MIFFLVLVLHTVLFSGCTGEKPLTTITPVNGAVRSNVAHSSAPEIRRITLIAAGDNLVHDIIYNNARLPPEDSFRTASIDGFNFDSCYQYIKPIIQKADIAFVNQETVLGGRRLGFSSYPVFNTPPDVGLALRGAGFNVINHASNHAMDRGEAAVFATMDFWDTYKDISYLGIFRSAEQRRPAGRIVEKNGIKTGFLSYTYGLNGFTLPAGKPWLVGMIDQKTMAGEIAELRPRCDLLVVSMHWGSEFMHEPSEAQKELAAFLAEQRVDLVIGHHPHVTQPLAYIRRPDGRQMICFYSLGDLLSHTQSRYTPDTMTGALAYIKVKKTPPDFSMAAAVNGAAYSGANTVIESAGVIPVVCHYGRERKKPFTVYPLWDYTEELAKLHWKNGITLSYLEQVSRQVFGSACVTKGELFP